MPSEGLNRGKIEDIRAAIDRMKAGAPDIDAGDQAYKGGYRPGVPPYPGEREEAVRQRSGEDPTPRRNCYPVRDDPAGRVDRGNKAHAEAYSSPCALPSEHEGELVVIAMEECSEVAQRLSKQFRFGKDEVMPGQDVARSNAYQTGVEWGQLLYMMELLGNLGYVDRAGVSEGYDKKPAALDKYVQRKGVK